MSICVGEVVAVKGTQITLRLFEDSNLEALYYEGKKYSGVSIREFVGVKRGFSVIVCIVEGEYLDERLYETQETKKVYVRKVDCKPIGYFQQKTFNEGIKLMPMIADKAFLLSESQVKAIVSPDPIGLFSIGKTLKEELPVSLPWQRLFNSHIGIFGNTGSGKSNTLTAVYSKLFEQFETAMHSKSQFLLIDFNGEYTGNQLIQSESNKESFKLNTRSSGGEDKFPLPSGQLWNTELLSLLFQATTNTQTPFINRVVEGRATYGGDLSNLLRHIKATIERAFTNTYQRREVLNLLKELASLLKFDTFKEELGKCSWNSNSEKYEYRDPGTGTVYLDGQVERYDRALRATVNMLPNLDLDQFSELSTRIRLQLINDLIYGHAQFDFIQPLLKRIDSTLKDLNKIFSVSDESQKPDKLLNVISLRNCNQTMKKIVPLILAKMFYQEHRNSNPNSPTSTLHFIIDEAHNILSEQSNREHESWKDYRLEMFEEIIKEGRKFGMFLTLSSQRPADISPTIMSQLHNFFIHRLVNDRDLALIDNTISTLDAMSKGLIPNLAKGSCVLTGTAFDIPLVIQVDKLLDGQRPDSDDVVLELLWLSPVNEGA